MKVICQIARRNLKYTIGIVALFLFVLQVYNIVGEAKLESIRLEELETVVVKRENPEIYVEKTQSDIQCAEGQVRTEILMGIFKCSLAFLFGGLLSEMKFIKFGII
jgi:hypothetical protein